MNFSNTLSRNSLDDEGTMTIITVKKRKLRLPGPNHGSSLFTTGPIWILEVSPFLFLGKTIKKCNYSKGEK